MRHCPDCRLRFSDRRDVCPECWSRLELGPPPDPKRLTLVFETSAFFEADLLEVALREEGIPCLRLPRLPWLPTLSGLRPTPPPRLRNELRAR